MDLSNDKENLEKEGMNLYQYIVDHCETNTGELTELILKLRNLDTSGQFLASTARYLAAVDRARFEPWACLSDRGGHRKRP